MMDAELKLRLIAWSVQWPFSSAEVVELWVRRRKREVLYELRPMPEHVFFRLLDAAAKMAVQLNFSLIYVFETATNGESIDPIRRTAKIDDGW